jgi:hypothetical protein
MYIHIHKFIHIHKYIYLDEKLYEMVGLIDERDHLLSTLKTFILRDVLEIVSGHIEEGD